MKNRISYWIVFLLGFQTVLFAKVFQMKGEPILLARGDGVAYIQPRWSPDGKQLAFTSSNYQGLWVMDMAEKNIRKITGDAAVGFGFEWSNDAQAIVSRVSRFEKFRRYNAVKLFDLATAKARLLSDFQTKMTGLPHWSPTDEQVYLYNRNKLQLFDTGKKARQSMQKSADTKAYFLKDEQPAEVDLMTRHIRVFEQLKDKQCLNLEVSPDHQKIALKF